MAGSLRDMGLLPGKATRTGCLPPISPQLLGDFCRGYFDGDGSLTLVRDRDKYSYLSLCIVGGEGFINQLTALFRQIGSTARICDSRTPGILYVRTHGGNNLRPIHQFMYRHPGPFLARKALPWVRLYLPPGQQGTADSASMAELIRGGAVFEGLSAEIRLSLCRHLLHEL